MKLSSYNLIIYKSPYSYWYNTFTKNFFRLSMELGEKVNARLEEGPGEETDLPASLMDKLKEGGFLIDDDFNETEAVKDLFKKAVNRKNYFMVVLPTLDCNYHCWYCIQNHVDSKMSDETLKRIKLHIGHMVNVEKIESLHLDWFGGEPLLYFHEIIEPVSRYAMGVCEKAGIPFMNSTTTNGYFLTKDKAQLCKELQFLQFQITLDGNREFHDNVKFQKGCESTFNHVLANIDRLLSLYEEINFVLRINYTHKNLSPSIVDEVNAFISTANHGKITILPRKVWQEKIDRSFSTTLYSILDRFKEEGYKVEYWSPISNYMPCYASSKYYNAFNFNGNVVKCTACNDLYDDNPRGILLEDGTIEWSGRLDERYTEPTFCNERCLKCRKLPICMGLCPKEHVNGSSYCKEEVMDSPFSDSIVKLIDRCYKND